MVRVKTLEEPCMVSQNHFDAIVVGSGANGSVASMVLAQSGLNVLILEAGPDLCPHRAFSTEPLNTVRRLVNLNSNRSKIQAQHPGYWKTNPELFVDEQLNPYCTPIAKPFLWSRGRQVGGKSLTWGGITLRLSDFEFKAGLRDGYGPSWPISHKDLDKYYTYIETMLGIHGYRDGLPQLPDGNYQIPFPFTQGEKELKNSIYKNLGLPLIHSRGFCLRQSQAAGSWPRSTAQGGALGIALSTGKVRICSNSIVSHIELDSTRSKATGVVYVNRNSGNYHHVTADLVVLCASTIETVRILLNSSETQNHNGLIDPSGLLGHYLIDHISHSCFFNMEGNDFSKQSSELSGAGSTFIPNTVNLDISSNLSFLRGYGIWSAIQRFDPPSLLKRYPNKTAGFLIGHGEVLPQYHNKVSLTTLRDTWGIPIVQINCDWGENEHNMIEHMHQRMVNIVNSSNGVIQPLENLFKVPFLEPFFQQNTVFTNKTAPPGYYIHELGGARMSNKEEDGVVNSWGQVWRCTNLLVTDGACWPSAGWQSPTLTQMAITWRACKYAIHFHKK
uniref:Glucose-methanol-choline (GMC) oxidoreductase:NAD binding site n=1 Tax=Paulinella longichromatophora TaxID=1708747 RepID=A0A2H4ZQ78_9EUKA|nr:Glucose-methanol-choline (GMC) oxidoreductase:NAD binding site [Paulinella longichromatophora]